MMDILALSFIIKGSTKSAMLLACQHAVDVPMSFHGSHWQLRPSLVKTHTSVLETEFPIEPGPGYSIHKMC